MNQYGVVFITVPNEQEAEKIAKALVEQNIVGCVNIIPKIRSIYLWEGDICDDSELLLIAKTKKEAFNVLKNTVQELHSYDVPEIILLPIEKASENYAKWLDECVSVK